MAKELTKDVKKWLGGKLIEDKRGALTELHKEGYNVKPYLEEMLTCVDGVDRKPEEKGFDSATYADTGLVFYKLSDGKTTFFYKKLGNRAYKSWR